MVALPATSGPAITCAMTATTVYQLEEAP